MGARRLGLKSPSDSECPFELEKGRSRTKQEGTFSTFYCYIRKVIIS